MKTRARILGIPLVISLLLLIATTPWLTATAASGSAILSVNQSSAAPGATVVVTVRFQTGSPEEKAKAANISVEIPASVFDIVSVNRSAGVYQAASSGSSVKLVWDGAENPQESYTLGSISLRVKDVANGTQGTVSVTSAAITVDTVDVSLSHGSATVTVNVPTPSSSTPASSSSSSSPSGSFSLNRNDISFSKIGERYVLSSANSSYSVTSWSADNTAVATVSATGLVTSVGPGTTTVRATAQNGATASCVVRVKTSGSESLSPGTSSSASSRPSLSSSVAGGKSVTGVSLNQARMILSVGDATALVATVQPANAANQALTWISSNPDVASVDENGNVMALEPGRAFINVVTQDGNKVATCTLTVEAASDSPSSTEENISDPGEESSGDDASSGESSDDSSTASVGLRWDDPLVWAAIVVSLGIAATGFILAIRSFNRGKKKDRLNPDDEDDESYDENSDSDEDDE